MKRSLSYLAVVTAILSAIVFTVIPHHHHQDVVCMMTERCEQDDTYNEEHTGHSQDAQKEDSCREKNNLTTVVSSKSQSDLLSDGSQPIFVPVLFVLSDLWNAMTEEDIRPACAAYRVDYTSVVRDEAGGLRAPPCLLC